jgi:ribosome production factor 2
LIETVKNTLIIRGNHTSQLIMDVLSDFAKLTKPNGKSMSRKNDIFPFEDANSLEFLTEKNDCALFVFGSHSKKRPNNLILVSHHAYIISSSTSNDAPVHFHD